MSNQTIKPRGVPNLAARLTKAEQAFRKTLLDLLIQVGRPVAEAELATGSGWSTEECGGLVSTLAAKGLLVKNVAGEIAFVYPVSALPTRHRVTLADGRAFSAMCAIDALGCAFEFARDAAVTSSCSHCQRPLSVRLAGGRVAHADPPTIQVLHVDLDQYGDWAANC